MNLSFIWSWVALGGGCIRLTPYSVTKSILKRPWDKPGNLENSPIITRPALCLPPTVCPLVILDGPQIQHLVHLGFLRPLFRLQAHGFFLMFYLSPMWLLSTTEFWLGLRADPTPWLQTQVPLSVGCSPIAPLDLRSPLLHLFLSPSCWPPDPSRFCDPLASAWA